MKQCYCLLEKFNNYFNRKIIKYESLSDYVDHSKDSFIPYNEDGSMTAFDFNPADNVTTEIIVNNVPFDPDYFLLLNTKGNIVQRWFIVEQRRNRQGQWVYYLKRDVISDNFNSLLKAPIFVEKGMLNEDDAFIVNDEGMSLNQIKKQEIKLLDDSRTAWIVGYMAKNAGGSDINVQSGTETIDIDYKTLSQIASHMGITESKLISLINFGDSYDIKSYFTTSVSMRMYLFNDIPAPIDHYFRYSFNFNSEFSMCTHKFVQNEYDIFINPYLFKKEGSAVNSEQLGILRDCFAEEVIANQNNWRTYVNGLLDRADYFTELQLNQLKSYNGVLIKYNGNYYRFNVYETSASSTVKEEIVNDGTNVALASTASDTVTLASSRGLVVTSDIGFKLDYLKTEDKEVAIVMRTVSLDDVVPQVKTKISSSRNTTLDQEYDIFAIPLNIIVDDGTPFTTYENFSRIIASAIARENDAKVYDLQLLPYCPIPELVRWVNHLDITGLTVDEDYNFIQYYADGDYHNCGIIFYLQSATFTTIIKQSLFVNKSKKIVSNCYLWRLNSPNYQGSFDFNIAKNGGRVEYFNVFCTYKPYTPIIKIAPNFDWLYGTEFQDNRGLICGGDFSLPRVNDAWVSYQLNNKNYQNIFNREIQHLDFMQGIEMRNQLVSGAVGILSDTTKGAMAGGMAGGVYGAIAGGIVGGTASAVGFAVDVDTMAKTHRENRQLTIDKFNYQLGNIKALPYTLTKVGSFDVISKIFPFIEEYCCSDSELKAFEDKIKYESMTVMRIGTLEEYMNFNYTKNYFKGALIRNDEIADDSHVLNAIYEEFLKGVYI